MLFGSVTTIRAATSLTRSRLRCRSAVCSGTARSLRPGSDGHLTNSCPSDRSRQPLTSCPPFVTLTSTAVRARRAISASTAGSPSRVVTHHPNRRRRRSSRRGRQPAAPDHIGPGGAEHRMTHRSTDRAAPTADDRSRSRTATRVSHRSRSVPSATLTHLASGGHGASFASSPARPAVGAPRHSMSSMVASSFNS